MKLEEQLRQAIRQKGHAYNTEKSYVQKYHQFIQFARETYGEYRHPETLNQKDIELFLTHLAADRLVSADTQRVALSALKFLYETVLGQKLGILDFVPGQGSKKLPVVLTFAETSELLNRFSGLGRLQSEIMYGCGLRISDCLRLRVKDLDFASNTVQINDSKGNKNRLLMMPRSIKTALQKHVDSIRPFYDRDRADGVRGVWMPTALEKKAPRWGSEWGWFWVFPANKLSIESGVDCKKTKRQKSRITRYLSELRSRWTWSNW